jgi:acyl-coenzyme A synthetase/AMP-(fatty) acid ligase
MFGSPQCDSRAIRHLTINTSSRMLLYSRRLTKLAASVESICGHGPLPVHEQEDVHFPHDWWPTPSFVESSSVAYIHHTSGTSNGLPTPIPQIHASASVHLPFLMPQTPVSTFTTTPLYHGGVADLMRSMMSCSMIWLFPPTTPITAQNICRAIKAADERLPGSPVKLFTGVPYIQKMCLEDGDCLAALRKMDMVGYGGAQLPEKIGNSLVENGVNLVSRFGSTECGCKLLSPQFPPVSHVDDCSFAELLPKLRNRQSVGLP